MVGPMMLLKMLHCKKKSRPHRNLVKKQQQNNTYGEGTSQDRKLSKVNIKEEILSDETCRICLKEGKMPIFGENASEELCESIYEIGAVEVCADDPYPKYLCQSCYALLQGAILFKRTAQKSNELLHSRKEPTEKSEPISDIDELNVETGDESWDASGGDHYRNEIKVKCPKIHTCNVCNLQFNSLKEYKEHRLTAKHKKSHIASIHKWKCNVCDLKFNSFDEYSEHRLTAEHENKRITCPTCKKTYAHHYYKRHMSLHKQETMHMCDICGKSFNLQSQFSRHRLTHFYDLPFKCTLCPYRGRFTESLKMHMRSHTGEKPYQCDQCPSRFISKSNLNKHVLTHKGEHDFRCEVCGRGFYTKRELELHIKVDHTGIRDHVCRICGKAFGYRKQMMKHELRVHKRDKLKSGRMPIYLKLETMKQQNVDGVIEA